MVEILGNLLEFDADGTYDWKHQLIWCSANLYKNNTKIIFILKVADQNNFGGERRKKNTKVLNLRTQNYINFPIILQKAQG